MTSTTSTLRVVTVGVDTHGDVHDAAVIGQVGRPLADAGFPTTPDGYRQLLAWADQHGEIAAFEVESTGAYGAGLAWHLRAAAQTGIEVDRPDRRTRRRRGRSDPIDVYAAAAAVLSGAAAGTPKTRDGRCWSPPGTTPTGCAPRPPSPSSAAPLRYRPAAAPHHPAPAQPRR